MTLPFGAPRLDTHANAPLEVGMVLSIQSRVESAEAGFRKLEDTLIVTEHGSEVPGDTGRGWNLAYSFQDEATVDRHLGRIFLEP